MINTLLVYIHLLAACVAVGILLIQDYALARSQGKPLTTIEMAELKLSAHRVSLALSLLWITGIALVVNGYLGHPDYIINEKLWAKISVVAILTLNGFFLHHFCFPRLCTDAGINKLSLREKILLALSGSLSTTSWLFACYLGIARPWSYSIEYSQMMMIYACLIATAFIIACQCLWYFSRAEAITEMRLPVSAE
jgi:uncharacterized membrane protein